jgi:hypothetical protein
MLDKVLLFAMQMGLLRESNPMSGVNLQPISVPWTKTKAQS